MRQKLEAVHNSEQWAVSDEQSEYSSAHSGLYCSLLTAH
jgi:hypothetical protein